MGYYHMIDSYLKDCQPNHQLHYSKTVLDNMNNHIANYFGTYYSM